MWEWLIRWYGEKFYSLSSVVVVFRCDVPSVDSYKETCIQLYEIKKNVFLAMENLNTVVGQNVLNY